MPDSYSAIRAQIIQGDLDEALDQLLNVAHSGPHALRDEAIMLLGQRVHLLRNERQNIITSEQAGVNRQRIQQSALGLLTELERKLTSLSAPVSAPVVAADVFAGTESVAFQKIIGINNLKQVAWLEQGLRASQAVCRVLTPYGLGTGFLVGQQTLMTNNHVIPSRDVASQTKIEFNYQLPFGTTGVSGHSVRYALDPAALFHTSHVSDLDYTLVGLKLDLNSLPLAQWGVLHLNPNADPIPTEHVVIVQHPNGGPKQIVLTANEVLQVKRPHLHYSTDTMPGSSGSPVFNDLWQVIALHHAVGPELNVPDGVRFSNEGVLISAIKTDLGKDWPI